MKTPKERIKKYIVGNSKWNQTYPARFEITIYQDDKNLFTAELHNSHLITQGKTFKSCLNNLCKLINKEK